ncbi:peptidylprolyl isomerase [Alkalilimnicola sp. S0819]|uniref:foldase protein PrsA n=1 Tax=Alkalilimnicola sp. S0819 TaxID=2613922 RepID=UPI001261D89E|nr:peptidylprolyl isomerase [Alkalilimnicola sp. S0819]KAB7619627.1 peptidylprolyl isomerase [Alkalilimnicola sp. S0819]MPQ17564.1 peptidylprolyl isomerase [Alkalilimnicola sp. S0819]
MKKTLPLALLMLFGLSACNLGAEQPTAADTEGQTVLMRVDGTPITEEMLAFHLERRTGGQSAQLDEAQRDALMRELVDMVLLANAAEAQGLDQDPMLRARVTSVRQALLAQAAVENKQQDTAAVDEAAVQAAYEEMYSDSGALEYKARHILVEEQAEAQALIEELQQGADFAALAEEHSTGPSAAAGGDLGWFVAEQMVEPFAEALQTLEPGAFSQEPVQTQFGWHVIKLEETREQPRPALEDVEPQIRQQLAQQQVQDYLTELREQANIQYEDPALAPEQE